MFVEANDFVYYYQKRVIYIYIEREREREERGRGRKVFINDFYT